MKRILLIPLLFITTICWGQYPNLPTKIGTDSNAVIARGLLTAVGGIQVTNYFDTATANLYQIRNYPGTLIFTVSDGVTWIRDKDAFQWVTFGSGTNCNRDGGHVTWSGTNLIFDVTSASYCIDNSGFTFSGGSINLGTLPTFNSRFDVIGLNTSGQLFKINGVESSNPQIPTINPFTQLYLTAVLVTPNGVCAGSGNIVLWDENTGDPEWDFSADATADPNSSATPFHGSKKILVTNFENNQKFGFTGIGYGKNTVSALKFYIKLDNPVAPSEDIQVQLMTDGFSNTTAPISLSPSYGFNKNAIGVYQNVTIPTADFSTFTNFTEFIGVGFKLTQAVDGPAPTFSFDYLQFIGTCIPTTGSGGNFVSRTYKKEGTDSVFDVINGVDYFSHKDSTGEVLSFRYPLVKSGLEVRVDTSKSNGAIATYYDLLRQTLTFSLPLIRTGVNVIADTSKTFGKLATFTDVQSLWKLTGNAGTNPQNNFIGSTDTSLTIRAFERPTAEIYKNETKILSDTVKFNNTLQHVFLRPRIYLANQTTVEAGNVVVWMHKYSDSFDGFDAVGNADASILKIPGQSQNYATIAKNSRSLYRKGGDTIVHSLRTGGINTNGTFWLRLTSNAGPYSRVRHRLKVIDNLTNTIPFDTLMTGIDTLFYQFTTSGNTVSPTKVNRFTYIYTAVPTIVGINVEDPSNTLHVVGGVTIQDGTEGSGKVLTSDVDGKARWETPSGTGEGLTEEEVTALISDSLEANRVEIIPAQGLYKDGDYIKARLANGSDSGIVTPVQYAEWNAKQVALESGTNIKTINGVSPLGSGNIPVAPLNGVGIAREWILACSDETSSITTGTGKLTFRVPYSVTVTGVRASVNTASSSGIPTFDINENGTTILSTKLTIDASEKTSTTAVTAAVISDNTLADDSEITIDFDVAGTGAKGVKIIIYYTKN